MNNTKELSSNTINKFIENEKVIKHLFKRLSSMYGHIWNSQFINHESLEVTKTEWGRALGRFNVDAIHNAILHCLNNKKMPPTLPEFVEFCRIGNSAVPYHRDIRLKKLPKVSNREIGERHLEKIKFLLRNNNKEKNNGHSHI